MYFLQDTDKTQRPMFFFPPEEADNDCAKEMLMVLQGSDAQTKLEARSCARK